MIIRYVGDSISRLSNGFIESPWCPAPPAYLSLHVSVPHFMLCLGLKYPSTFCLLGLPPCKILDNLAHATWVKASLIPYSESIHLTNIYGCLHVLVHLESLLMWFSNEGEV